MFQRLKEGNSVAGRKPFQLLMVQETHIVNFLHSFITGELRPHFFPKAILFSIGERFHANDLLQLMPVFSSRKRTRGYSNRQRILDRAGVFNSRKRARGYSIAKRRLLLPVVFNSRKRARGYSQTFV